MSVEGERYKNCLREMRARATDVEVESIGRVIKKEEWSSLHIHIASENNFPTAAGLASSAAGFACLGEELGMDFVASFSWIFGVFVASGCVGMILMGLEGFLGSRAAQFRLCCCCELWFLF